ncbi:MAG TPA: hypothetical protein VIG24_09075 [Acidimicrobiia bacterium]
MSRGLRCWACFLVVSLAACGGDAEEPDATNGPAPGAETALGAVEDLIAAVNQGDFTGVSRLAMPGHAALAALAEGATFAEVASALEEGDEEIAANFWAGFAQGSGTFLTGSVTAEEDGTLTSGDIEFHRVMVQPAEGDERVLLVREDNGFKVDLFASFGSGLADKMITPAERLLTAQTADARLILARLQEIVPSLQVAASLPGTTIETSQHVIALIEVITRVG